MQFFHNPPTGDHRGYRCRQMTGDLLEVLPYHGDPDRAAAAGQLKSILCLCICTKFQCFLQSKNIGKGGNFDHSRRPQRLQGAPETPRSGIFSKLPDIGWRHQYIDRRCLVFQKVYRSYGIFTKGQIFIPARLYAGGASGTELWIEYRLPILNLQCLKHTRCHTLGI